MTETNNPSCAAVDVLAVAKNTPSLIVDASGYIVAQTLEVIDGRSNDRERTEKAWQLAREIVSAMNQRTAVAAVLAKLEAREADVGGVPDGWRCFHCREEFTDRDAAALHFGTHQYQEPACLIDIAQYREMEALQLRYANEDADVHRSMYKLQSGHGLALQRAEEAGYAKGLVDAVKYPQDVAPIPQQPAAEGDATYRPWGWTLIDNARHKIEWTNLQHVADEWRRDPRKIVQQTYHKVNEAEGADRETVAGWARPNEVEAARRNKDGSALAVFVHPERTETYSMPIYTHPSPVADTATTPETAK